MILIMRKVVPVTELWKDDSAWQKNAADNGGGMFSFDHANEDDEYINESIDSSLLLETDEQLCAFMGSEHQQEQFYPREEQIFERESDGTFWVQEHEALDDI